MSSDVVRGKVVAERPDGTVLIAAPITDRVRFDRQMVREYWVQPIDSRKLSDSQRNMCYALLRAISDYTGDSPESTKEYFKLRFMADNLDELGDCIFSLSNAPMSLVAGFQRFLVRFIVENGIQTKRPLLEYVDDINDYIYCSLIHKKCVICGRKADLHHVDRVGMGRDRTDILHEGMEALPLCREHHAEAHTMPDAEFFGKYHLDGGVVLDKTLCRIYTVGRDTPKPIRSGRPRKT